MISSGYTLDLYCDHPNHDKSTIHSMGGESFFTESKSECLRQARKAGWKINLKNWTCICRICQGKPELIIKKHPDLVPVTEILKKL